MQSQRGGKIIPNKKCTNNSKIKTYKTDLDGVVDQFGK